jgi:hypothetical protein
MKPIGMFIFTLVVGILSANALACGDSFYRVSKSLSYHVYAVPLPGNVLVYGQTEGARQLAEALRESGHTVEVAESVIDLSVKLPDGQYDVVIAYFGDRDAIEPTLGSSATTTTYLPVASNKQEEKIAEQSYDEVMLADRDELKDYLKAIHKTLKSRTS